MRLKITQLGKSKQTDGWTNLELDVREALNDEEPVAAAAAAVQEAPEEVLPEHDEQQELGRPQRRPSPDKNERKKEGMGLTEPHTFGRLN